MSSFFTRVERAAPIFSRITGLIRSGQMKWDERPLWYDAYVVYPPFDEPVWDKKMPKHDEPVRDLFYAEDVERAKKPISKNRIFEFDQGTADERPSTNAG